MNTGRLEAFSDGVIAILITIMVLELKAPHEADVSAIRPLLPVFLSYLLSFVFLGLYWNNHHHLFQAARQLDGRVLWANLHLLFWLSLVPVTTAWMGDSGGAPWPTAFYGMDLFLAAVAYFILTRTLTARHRKESALVIAVGNTNKEKISALIYLVGIAASFYQPVAAQALYVLVAIMWLVPDRRIEKTLEDHEKRKSG